MSEVCPKCERIVGKLYLICKLCGVHYCEDCIPSAKHYCPSYRDEDNKTVPSSNMSSITNSDEACREFAIKNTENGEEVKFLILREIKKRVVEGHGTLDMYICPRCINIRDTERFVCVHCNTERNLKCDWCGNHFMKYV